MEPRLKGAQETAKSPIGDGKLFPDGSKNIAQLSLVDRRLGSNTIHLSNPADHVLPA